MQHRKDIEGLRAIAVIAVLLFHFDIPGFGGGYVGVDVFFVISGYLITSLLINEREANGRISIRDFYARRARRLLPISVAVMAVTALASAIWLQPTRLPALANDIMAAAAFSVNFVFAHRGTDYLQAAMEPSAIQHYWSLAVEEQFYMVWPGLIALVTLGGKRIRHKIAIAMGLIVIVSFALSATLTSATPSWAYFGLHTRAWELGLGALLAALAANTANLSPTIRATLGWLGVGGIIVSVLSFADVVAFPGTIAAVPVIATGLALIAGDQVANGPVLILRNGFMQWVGARSYSLYLWHWSALIITQSQLGEDLSVTARIGVLLLVLGLSELGYRLIENPVRRSKALISRSAVSLVVGASLVLTGIGAGVALHNHEPDISTGVTATVPTLPDTTTTEPTTSTTAPKPKPTFISMAETKPLDAIVAAEPNSVVPDNVRPSLLNATTDTSAIYENGCHVYYDSEVRRDCVFGDPNGSVTVALWGDSHAAQWFVALDSIAKQRKWRLLSLTQGGCPFLDVETYNRTDDSIFRHCQPWRESVREYLREQNVAIVFMSQYYGILESSTQAPITTAQWQEKLPALLSGIKADGIKPVVIADTPDPPDSVPSCVSANRLNIGVCAPDPNDPDYGEIDSVIRRITRTAKVGLIEPRKWLCTPTACPVVVGDILVYRDSHHVSNTFMDWLTPVVRQLLSTLRPRAD